jgi:hypothetical protein
MQLYLQNEEESILQSIIQESLLSYKSFERKPHYVLILENNSEIDLNNLDTCTICQEDIKDDMVKLVCKHGFHTKCIKEWGMYKQECPTCRNEIPFTVNSEEN